MDRLPSKKILLLQARGSARAWSSPRAATRAETWLIALTVFCLPLFEAPKNVLGFLFLVVWASQAVRVRSLGSAAALNWPILGLAAVLWAAPLFSSYGDAVTALGSAPRWTLLALFAAAAARLDYTGRQLVIIWAALMVGGSVAVVDSFWVWHLNGKDYPEFRSVGHVNHSAMYALVSLAAGLGALYASSWWLRILGVAAVLSALVFLPPAQSLVAVAATAALLCVGAWPALSRFGLLASALGALAVSGLVLGLILLAPSAEGLEREFLYRFTGGNPSSGRLQILNSALAVWDLHPLLGTGWFSFGLATSEEAVRAALEAEGELYDPAVYWHYSHGHNLWTTILIERGLVGVALVAWLLYLYLRAFLPLVAARGAAEPLARAAAVAALLVVVGFIVAGLGNTTMMNEHGQAGMALIAVAYGYLRGRGLVGSQTQSTG